MNPVRVLLVDDHAILRAGLRQLINAQSDLRVVAEAGNAAEALQQAQACDPHVILLDVSLPGQSGLQIIERLKQACPHARVLILTMHDETSYLHAALAAGCSGYIVKSAADRDLLRAIRTVRDGRSFVMLNTQSGDAPPLSDTPLPGRLKTVKGQELSARERTVLALLAQGYTNQQSADRLFLSTKTVETYRLRIARKLGLRSRADFVRYGVEMGFLTPGSTAEQG